MKKNTIIFLKPGHFIGPRVKKMINVAYPLFDELYFFAADRDRIQNPDIENDAKFTFKKVGVFYPYKGTLSYFYGTFCYMMACLYHFIKIKPTVIHASDLEASIPAYMYKIINPKVYLMVNVHDNFYGRYNISKFWANKLKWFEYRIYKKASVHLFPDANRVALFLPYKFDNVLIIPNTPPDTPYQAPSFDDGKVKLMVAGFIGPERGLNLILDLVRNATNLELHMAGRMSESELNIVKSTPNVVYHGIVSQEKVFEIGKKCHILPVLYAPDRELHVYASPNKLYDAYVLGRPVIVNKPIKVADEVAANGLGEVIEYGKVENIQAAIDKIMASREVYEAQCLRTRKYYEDEYHWDNYQLKITELFNTILKNDKH